MDKNGKRGESISESIKVFCRVRPDMPEETADTNEEDNIYLTGNSDQESGGNRISNIDEEANQCSYFSSSSKSEQKFKMDGFFGPTTSQETLYERAVRPIVDSTLEGYSATVFCYGPTGSGKTYSMMGDDENKGVIPRVFDQLLAASRAGAGTDSTNGEVILKVSYLQIYCEVVSDLLDPAGSQLSIRERQGEVYVENLSESIVTCFSDVQRIIERGDINRNTATTNMNAHSSRSHAAMLVKIFTPDASDSSGMQQKSLRESTLVLVDLAGSERAAAIAGKSYLRAEESKSINLSLSALGNCIAALSAGSTQTALGASSTRKKHVPYRDSKLTRLLQGSLGGSSRTAVIVNLPPGQDSTGEVLNALRFAHRCSTISVVAKVRRVVDYESLYAELQKRLDEQEQRESQQQQDLDKQYESIELQEASMEALRDEIKELTAKNEQLQAERASGGTSSEPDMKKCVDDMATQSALELNNMKQRYEKRIAAYKAAATESTQEISELQYDIRAEKEKHLATLKDLNVVNERYSEAERTFEFRIQELLTELEEAKSAGSEKATLVGELEAKDTKISELEEKIYLLEENGGGGGDMVSRQQVEEMEKMFSETVDQLVKRVLLLEESKGGGGGAGGKAGITAMGDSDEEDEMAYLDKVGPSLRKAGNRQGQGQGGSSYLPPAVPVRSSGNARFEPGKVRATGNSGSSHHLGGNFGAAGGAKNSRRF